MTEFTKLAHHLQKVIRDVAAWQPTTSVVSMGTFLAVMLAANGVLQAMCGCNNLEGLDGSTSRNP